MPYKLDESPTFSSVLQQCKKSIEDIQKYIDDYNKRMSWSQMYQKSAITEKVKRFLASMNQYKRIAGELADQFFRQ